MKIERNIATDEGKSATIYLMTPEKGQREDEFFCVIGIEGDWIERSSKIYGIDSMQALLLAVRHMNGFVQRASASIHPRRLVWEMGEEGDEFGLVV